MCASSGTKFSLMNEAVCSSLYDSASSRAHAPQAGAALKSTSRGLLLVFASASAASASVIQFTFIVVLLNHRIVPQRPQRSTQSTMIYIALWRRMVYLLPNFNISARAQAHQPGRQHTKIFNLPCVAVSKPYLSRRNQCSFSVPITIQKDFRVPDRIVSRSRAVTQFKETEVALVEDRQLRTSVSPCIGNDGVCRNADAGTELYSTCVHL